MLATVIATLVIITAVYLAVRYIYKEKKKGKACIGCPYSGSCSGNKDLENFHLCHSTDQGVEQR